MKRIIVDYKKLTPQLLKLLTEKFPDGYDDKDIITFDNHHNETIQAVEESHLWVISRENVLKLLEMPVWNDFISKM